MTVSHDNQFAQCTPAQFASDLQLPGCEVHLYKTAKLFGGLVTPETIPSLLARWENDNLYFLPGVKPGVRARAADSDVLVRGMFTCDFDIRKELEKGSRAVTEKDVESMAETIIATLRVHSIYGKMRYGVLSGNGLHVHYFGSPVIVEKQKWAAGLKEVFTEIAGLTPIPPDFGCNNAGRIMRMPYSWNVKEAGKRKPVRMTLWRPSAIVPPLAFIQERGARAIEKSKEQKIIERSEFKEQHPENGSEVIDLINRIPIEQVVSQLLGCRVRAHKKDGGMRFADEKGIERGFFKHQRYNIIVHEGTSLFAPPKGVGYNCFGLAKVILECSAKKVIEWFAQRSAVIREAEFNNQEKFTGKRFMLLSRKNHSPTFYVG